MATNFSRAVAQVAVAQLAEDAGFETAQTSSLDILSDLLLRYIAEIGRSAHSYADCAQRSCPNADDVLKGLSDMGVRLEDITAYTSVQEVPFAHVLPSFPVQRQPRWPPNFDDKSEEPPKHIPPWLPALPDKHTYVATPAFDGHDPDQTKQRKAIARSKRQAEKALVRLRKRATVDSVTGKGGELTTAAVRDDAGVRQSDTTGNPFLAAPTWEAASSAAAAKLPQSPASKSDVIGHGGESDKPSAGKASPSLEEAFAAAAVRGSARDGDTPAMTGPVDEGAVRKAPFSQQWSPAAVVAAGSGPSRLKEPPICFREQEDAFAAAEKAETVAAELDRVRMGRKAAAKSRTGRAPSEAPGRAQSILNAGADAVVALGDNEGGKVVLSDDE